VLSWKRIALPNPAAPGNGISKCTISIAKC
jgi:hypothetical protein